MFLTVASLNDRVRESLGAVAWDIGARELCGQQHTILEVLALLGGQVLTVVMALQNLQKLFHGKTHLGNEMAGLDMNGPMHEKETTRTVETRGQRERTQESTESMKK